MSFGPLFSAPDPSLGYYRGAPTIGGGKPVSKGITGHAAGIGSAPSSSTSWQPTVKYMLAMVIGEIILFGLMGKLAGI